MLVPNYYFDTVYDIPIELLKKEKIRHVLLDIDNTLVPYDSPEPTEQNKRWFESLKQKGIGVIFVSNNKPERVALYGETLDFPYIADAGKPGTRKIRTLVRTRGLDLGSCMVIGDQIFTDVLTASRLGVKSILVRSIKDVPTAFFKFKRFFEKPFIRIGKKRMKSFSLEAASDGGHLNRKGET